MLSWLEDNWFILVALWLVYELTVNGIGFGRQRVTR